jgi:hypothetical protein
MKTVINLILIWGAFLIIGGVAPAYAGEQASEDVQVRVFNEKLGFQKQLDFVDQSFQGVMDFTLVDLGGDGVNEMIMTYGYQDYPELKIYRYDGSEINSWQPYPVGYEGKINVTTGDFDGDGKDEIVTSPGEGGGPHIRMFDGYGESKFGKGFFAGDELNRKGVEIATGDVDGDASTEVIASMLEDGKNVIKFFNREGVQLHESIIIEVEDSFEPMKVSAYDLDNDGQDEIVLGAGMGNQPWVRVFDYTGEQIIEFQAYGSEFRGGIEVAGVKFNGEKYIVTAPGFSGGPHVRYFDLSGRVQLSPTFFTHAPSYRGGLNVAIGRFAGGDELVVSPQTVSNEAELTSSAKTIKVDVSDQRLYAYDRGRLVKTFLISSGRNGYNTPEGVFNVFRKKELVTMSWYYGKDDPNNYSLENVPHVLYFKGPYTLHGAYWHSNWGYRMSHGCVNIALNHAEWLYNWSPVGTRVIVQK